MVLYLDTSTLVKLYVDEPDSTAIADLVNTAQATATSIIAYAEARAAFARRFREKSFSKSAYQRIVLSLNEDWPSYLLLKLNETVVRLAGELAEKHALRGFDAIHLASALTLRRELGARVTFSCADRKLQQASKSEEFVQP